MAKQEKGGRTALGPILIVSLLLLIIVFSVYIAVYTTNDGPSYPTQISRGEKVKTYIYDEEGNTHSLEARFAVELDNELKGTNDEKAIFASINKTLKDLNYDYLLEENGLDYVKSEIMQALKKDPDINTDAIVGIYATDFVMDFALPTDELPKQNSIFNVLKSLFKGIK